MILLHDYYVLSFKLACGKHVLNAAWKIHQCYNVFGVIHSVTLLEQTGSSVLFKFYLYIVISMPTFLLVPLGCNHMVKKRSRYHYQYGRWFIVTIDSHLIYFFNSLGDICDNTTSVCSISLLARVPGSLSGHGVSKGWNLINVFFLVAALMTVAKITVLQQSKWCRWMKITNSFAVGEIIEWNELRCRYLIHC